LTQAGLIEQVVKDVGLTDFSKGKDTPVNSILHADKDGAERHFVGMWHCKHTHLHDNVLSRTGYIIFFGGCPVTWASHVHT